MEADSFAQQEGGEVKKSQWSSFEHREWIKKPLQIELIEAPKRECLMNKKQLLHFFNCEWFMFDNTLLLNKPCHAICYLFLKKKIFRSTEFQKLILVQFCYLKLGIVNVSRCLLLKMARIDTD